MPETATADLRTARDAVVREHMDSENRLDFEFTGDRIVCERVYFDTATIFRQIGLLDDPAGPP